MRAHELEESAVDELKNRLPKLKRHNYDTIDRLMQNISVKHKITGKKLHDMFVKKYGHTPDTWIKKIKNRLGEEDVTESGHAHYRNYSTSDLLRMIKTIKRDEIGLKIIAAITDEIMRRRQGVAEGSLEEDEYDKMLRDLLKARPDLTKKYAKDVQKSKDIESGKELNKLVKKNPSVLKTYSDAVKRDKKLGVAEDSTSHDCKHCNGKGYHTMTKKDSTKVATNCPQCKGKGYIVTKGVAESGYRHGFADPNSPSLGKRHREDDEYHVPDPVDTRTWYIRANGKIVKDKMGTPYQYRNKETATKAARTMMAKSFNAGKKFVLTTKPEDEQGVMEGDVLPLKRPMNKVQHGKRTFPPTQRDVKEPEGNITPLSQKKSNVNEGVEGPEDIQKIKDFIKWSYKTLNMQKPYPKITISKNTKVAQAGHHTGVHKGNDIWVYVGNRNLIDIFRTIFHELTHHRQMQLNMIKDGDSYPGSPIEMLADMAAGKYIKVYGKDHPEMFQ